MKIKFFVLLATSALAFSVACGDSETTDDGSGASGAGTSTGGGMGTGGSASAQCLYMGEARAMSGDCKAACEILFCCAEQQCAPIMPADQATFVTGCEETCATMMATIAVVNGEDCAGTVGIVRSASATFGDTCDNGVSAGTGGGGGA